MADPKRLKVIKGGLDFAKRLLAPEEVAAARSRGLGVPGVDFADPAAPASMRMSEALGNAGAEGKTLNFTEADRSRVQGQNRGGVGFSGLQHFSKPHKKANTVWGFGNIGTAEKKIRQNDPENSLWTTFVGSPDQHKSNSVVIGDAIKEFQKSVKQGVVPVEQIMLMNKRLNELTDLKTGAKVFQNGFDLTDPSALSVANTFARRAAVGDVMLGLGVKGPMARKDFKNEFPGTKFVDASDIENILKRETDPDLVNAGTYDVGNRLFVLDGKIIERPDLNEAFAYQVTGNDLGLKYGLVPPEKAMRDFYKAREGRLDKNQKPSPVTYYDLARAEPSQLVDEDYLTYLQKAGYKEGGAVDMEAADARLAQAIQARMANGGAVDMEAADARLQAAIQARMGGEKVVHMAGGGKLKALGDIAKKFLVDAPQAEAGKSAVKFGDKVLPVTMHPIEAREGNVLANVNPQAFDKAFKKTEWQYVGPQGQGGISDRYNKFGEFAQTAPSMNASNVSVDKIGRITFGDGRHRYAYLRDQGVNSIPMSMDKESLANAKLHGLLNDGVKGTQDVLSTAERDANLAKFLEGSKAPPTVYHATSQDVNQFSPKKMGSNTKHPTAKLGFFTAANPESTEDFISSTSGISKGLYESGANIMPLHLSIKNPYEIPSSQYMLQSMALQNMKKKDAEKFIQDFKDSLIQEGHDGLLIKANPRGLAKGNEYSSDNWVAFEPEQIKSAISNRGTYDITDPDISKAKGGLMMAGGGDPLDQFSPPRYRSAGRRPENQNDRKAAANMPMDFARGLVSGIGGAPGDIESLIRMIPGLERSRTLSDLVTGNHRETYLPTSEDIEKRLPFRSDTPAGQAASGLGTLAGGFYTGPGAPIRLVGGLPKAVMKAGKDFGRAAGQPAANVVKPTGGNFLLGRTEKDLQPLKTPTFVGETPAQRISKHEELLKNPTLSQDQRDRVQRMLDATKGEAAIDKWVDSNLTNYVKKQMGTADDPVRKLAEQGITHNPGLLRDNPYLSTAPLRKQRREAGFPEEGMGQSPAAQAWEQASDEAIATHRAGDIQEMPERFAKFTEAENKMRAARSELDEKFKQHIAVAGLNEREEANLIRGTAFDVKAKMVGDTDYAKANTEYINAHVPMMDNYMELGRQNPYINKLAPETPMYAPFTGDLGFDHIMDVLREDVTAGRIRPEQLSKVSMEQAVRRTFEYDQELAAKMNASRAAAREGLPTYREYPEGYKWIQLNKPGAFSQESEAMGHSVRGYEPPKGHPDWVEGSGDSGSLSYGQGGWEAIKSGKTKVYSLVDSKGAPHATVETKIGGGHEYAGEKNKEIIRLAEERGIQKYMAPGNESLWAEAEKNLAERGITPPQNITQIKGKGNRAPNEEYLPYIQDFVKGGQWSDVGDLRNTGLTRKSDLIDKFSPDELDAIGAGEYVTRAEQDDLLLRALRPPEGMAHGGALSKLQFMDKGGITTSGGTFSPEELGISASDLSVMDDKTWDAIKRNAPGVYEEEKQKAKQKIKDEVSQLKSARGIKDFALRVGASYAGAIPDLANFLLMAPDAVLGTELASEKPWFGSAQYLDAMNKAGLLGENEFPIAETVAGLLTPAGLIKKGVKKGVQLFSGKKPEAPKKRRGGLAAMAR